MVMVSVVSVTVAMVTWEMAPSCPREPSGPRQTDTLGGSSPTSDSRPSDMLKYKHHSTSGRGSIDTHTEIHTQRYTHTRYLYLSVCLCIYVNIYIHTHIYIYRDIHIVSHIERQYMY